MGLDAAHGLLEDLLRQEAPSPRDGSSLYLLGEEAVLHSTGIWYRGVLYHRPKERFYRASLPPYPPEVHPGAEPLPFPQASPTCSPSSASTRPGWRPCAGRGGDDS